jgi:hypothetical protein
LKVADRLPSFNNEGVVAIAKRATEMIRSGILWLLWFGFIVYILLFAPPLQPNTFQPMQQLLSGQIPSINPVLLSLFSMVGIWLLIYSCLIFPDGKMQSLPAWASMLASLGTGVLALIPYLALRKPNSQFVGSRDRSLVWLESPWTGIILSLSTLALLTYALLFGDWPAFWYEFWTNRFIHGMSLAFVLFGLLFPFPTMLGDDMARRGFKQNSLSGLIAFVPLFGPLLYLCLRPPLAFRSA